MLKMKIHVIVFLKKQRLYIGLPCVNVNGVKTELHVHRVPYLNDLAVDGMLNTNNQKTSIS